MRNIVHAINKSNLILSSAAAKPRRVSKDARARAASNKSGNAKAAKGHAMGAIAIQPHRGHRVLSASIATFALPILFVRSVPDVSAPHRLLLNESI